MVRLQTRTPAVGPVEILAPDGDHPLMARFPYGAGSVTLVALDLAEEPFISWQGYWPNERPKFAGRVACFRGPA